MARALIAVLGIGRGSWGHVARLISEEEWEKILLIGNEWGKENFAPSKEVDWIIVNNRAGFEVIKSTIKEKLPEEDIFLSLISGSGKEHMALIAALREANKDFKIVVLTGEGTKYY
jgi:hypothetical protein